MVWDWVVFDVCVKVMVVVFVDYGVLKGDRVLVQLCNCNQMIESMYVCFCFGVVWVFVNFCGVLDDLVWMVELFGVKFFLCDVVFFEYVLVKGLEYVIVIGEIIFVLDIEVLM